MKCKEYMLCMITKYKRTGGWARMAENTQEIVKRRTAQPSNLSAFDKATLLLSEVVNVGSSYSFTPEGFCSCYRAGTLSL